MTKYEDMIEAAKTRLEQLEAKSYTNSIEERERLNNIKGLKEIINKEEK